MFLRPTAPEERWLAVAARYPALHDAAEARAGGWKSPSLLSRALMFVLGLFASSLIVGSVLWFPARWFLAGVLMVAAGEWLIHARRLVAGGIEEALIGCGLVCIAGQVLSLVEGSGDVTLMLGISLAVLVAGLRLGNALFTTLAAAGVSIALAFVGAASLFGREKHDLLAMSFCIALALLALALGARRWQRPSHDRMLDGLVIAMPAMAQLWAQSSAPASGLVGAVLPSVLALAFAGLLAVLGVHRRTHAPLLGALVQLACLVYAMRELTGLPIPARMILGGSVLLALGFALDRGLRRPRRGVTSAPLGPRSRVTDLLQVYGSAHVTPAAVTPQAPAFEGQGGTYGGGGASGRF